MSREKLPDRRRGWTQKVRIGHERTVFYLTTGEYPDGRIGEFWLATHKEGTFARGLAGALARMASIALQNGTPLSEVVKSLRHLNFPPNGPVIGDGSAVSVCSSVCDWVAQELEAAYIKAPEPIIVSDPPKLETDLLSPTDWPEPPGDDAPPSPDPTPEPEPDPPPVRDVVTAAEPIRFELQDELIPFPPPNETTAHGGNTNDPDAVFSQAGPDNLVPYPKFDGVYPNPSRVMTFSKETNVGGPGDK